MAESKATPGSEQGATAAAASDLEGTGRDDGAAGARASSTGELVGRASEQLSDLVRGEMELARAELNETVKHAVAGVSLFGAAGLIAFYGGGVLIATAVLALALVLDAWLAALIVGVVLLAVAGIAALVGKKQVDQAPAPLQNSVENVKTDVDTVKRKAQS